jgi:3-hydroxyisobutyrate dehydrogenase-like beta-hydroxyacid dehydrogenase
MVQNLLRASHRVRVYDVRPAAIERLVELGAEGADGVASVAAAAEIVFTSLPTPLEVDRVAEDLLGAARPGTTWIETSASAYESARPLAERAARKGVEFLDAPVSGGAARASSGELTVFVGGRREALERCRPVLEPIGTTIAHMGEHGAGYAMKLVQLSLCYLNVVGLGEALALAARAGLDLGKTWEMLRASTGDSWVVEHYAPPVFDGTYDPSGTIDICHKDMRLVVDLGRALGVPTELASLVEQSYARARLEYGGDAPHLKVVKLLEDATGVDLRAR